MEDHLSYLVSKSMDCDPVISFMVIPGSQWSYHYLGFECSSPLLITYAIVHSLASDCKAFLKQITYGVLLTLKNATFFASRQRCFGHVGLALMCTIVIMREKGFYRALNWRIQYCRLVPTV